MDINEIRSQFPILQRKVKGKDLIYLDNTATSQTPARVVEAIERMYTTTKANVHRGVSSISQEATDLQEATRRRVAQWINASSEQEIIFTRGTTESINLVASSYGDLLENGDEIILTVMEHHANIVPWQLLGRRKRIILRVVPVNERGEPQSGCVPLAFQRAHQAGGGVPCVERARHGQPDKGDDSDGARQRCASAR